MDEQLPVPLDELLLFDLYLGSVSYLTGIIFISWIMKRNNNFNWIKLLILSILLVAFGCFFSMLIWFNWNSEISLMVGPLHLPTLIAVAVLSILLLKIFGYKVFERMHTPNKS